MSRLNKQDGFTALELLLTVVAVAAIGVAGYFAYQNLHKASTSSASVNSSSSSSSPTASPISNMLAITQWGVKLTLPAGLTGLSYTYNQNSSTVIVESSSLKSLPSICTGQATTDGSLANIVRSSTAPQSDSPGAPFPADLQRHIGSYYYALGLPNGSSCQSTTAKQQEEANQTALLKQAFQSLQ